MTDRRRLEVGAPAAEKSPTVDETRVVGGPLTTGWTVELDVDEGDHRDTVSYAWSPWAEEPEPASPGGRGLPQQDLIQMPRCPGKGDRQCGRTHQGGFRGAAPSCIRGGAGALRGLRAPGGLHSHWDGETVVMNAGSRASCLVDLPGTGACRRQRIGRKLARRVPEAKLVESGSTRDRCCDDGLGMGGCWTGRAGPILCEGAANAILEAGRPCGVG